MEFGAREVALEALVVLLASPEMALATELARIPKMELAKALEIAPSNRWVLSSLPWVSFAMADLLTWLGIVLPEVLAARASPKALAARASLEEELLSAAEGQE